MDPAADIWDILLRLAAAVLCGALLGFEREAQNKPAGLRTHMMVALGSAAFTLLALELAEQTAGAEGKPDPTRVMQGIVGGIGFLGAGSIIQSKAGVRGVTTASGIWVMGAIGIACGGGRYLIAVATTAFAVVIMSAVLFVEKKFFKNNAEELASEPSGDMKTAQDSPANKAAEGSE